MAAYLRNATSTPRVAMTTEPLFKAIFAEDWPHLPKVFHKHYAPRPGCADMVRVEGKLDVRVSPLVSWLARLTGALIPWSGNNIPIDVAFRIGDDGKSFHFDRAFHYPNHGTCHFRSHMVSQGGNELIEFIKFGIGWRLAYGWDGEKVTLTHKGYVWRIFGLQLSLPLNLILGRGYAEEKSISPDSFHMWTHMKHPLFGEMLYYSGEFTIKEVICETTS